MQYQQKFNETLDDFITRARTITQKCDFTDEDLIERRMELIIFSTPYDAFCNELYSNPKSNRIANLLTEGRKHKVLTARNDQLNQPA